MCLKPVQKNLQVWRGSGRPITCGSHLAQSSLCRRFADKPVSWQPIRWQDVPLTEVILLTKRFVEKTFRRQPARWLHLSTRCDLVIISSQRNVLTANWFFSQTCRKPSWMIGQFAPTNSVSTQWSVYANLVEAYTRDYYNSYMLSADHWPACVSCM